MWLLFCYTIQLITIKLCTKFQNPKSSSCWEIFDRKKSLQTDRQTDKQTSIVTEKAKTIYPLYFIGEKENEQIKGLKSNMWLEKKFTDRQTNRQTLLQKRQKLYTPYILRRGGGINVDHACTASYLLDKDKNIMSYWVFTGCGLQKIGLNI